MSEQLALNAVTTLASGVTNVATSLAVAAGTGALFPASGSFRISIGSEIILVGSRSTDTFNSLTRAQEGTFAAAYSTGTNLANVVTPVGLLNYISGNGIVRQSTITLNDTQIKALPTTPVIAIAAPGTGFALFPLFGVYFAKTTAGAYTNINAAGVLNTTTPGYGLSYVPNDVAITTASATRLTDLLGGAANKSVNLQAWSDTEGMDQWGPVGLVETTASVTNGALTISIDNAGGGVLTGGNSANTLTLVVFYTIVVVP